MFNWLKRLVTGPIGKEILLETIAEGSVEGFKSAVKVFGQQAGESIARKFTSEHVREAFFLLQTLYERNKKDTNRCGDEEKRRREMYNERLKQARFALLAFHSNLETQTEQDQFELGLGEVWWALGNGYLPQHVQTLFIEEEFRNTRGKITKKVKSPVEEQDSFNPVEAFDQFLIAFGNSNPADTRTSFEMMRQSGVAQTHLRRFNREAENLANRIATWRRTEGV